jgi:transposase
MNQAQRDRLVVLNKCGKGVVTQAEASLELGVTVRHVKRLVKRWKAEGDACVIHGLRGKPSARRKIEVRQQALAVLREPVYAGFGPTLAAEYLRDKHKIEVSKEALRQWMSEAGLWKPKRAKAEQAHPRRARRSRCGELVQWDTSTHDWLEGRGRGLDTKIYLIHMIDDATSQLTARFVLSDSTEQNMGLLRQYLETHGRPLAFYTDKAALFLTTPKVQMKYQTRSSQQALGPTQIERALSELGIVWIPAHSPQAKGRVERSFQTSQDRLVKGLRVAGAKTLDDANAYLETVFVPWWNRTLAVKPHSANDAHRALASGQVLDAILSHVETRQVANGYVVAYGGNTYRIDRRDIKTGLRGSVVHVEHRWNGDIAMRSGKRYLRIEECVRPEPVQPKAASTERLARTKAANAGGKSAWMQDFFQKPTPPIGKAIAIANGSS